MARSTCIGLKSTTLEAGKIYTWLIGLRRSLGRSLSRLDGDRTLADVLEVEGSFQHVRHGDALEESDHLSLGLRPHALHLAAIQDGAVVVMAFDALVEPKRPLDALDDLEERDLPRGPRESVASVGALLRLHHAAIREKRQDLRQKRLRDSLGFRDLADPAVALGRDAREIDHGAEGVVALA